MAALVVTLAVQLVRVSQRPHGQLLGLPGTPAPVVTLLMADVFEVVLGAVALLMVDVVVLLVLVAVVVQQRKPQRKSMPPMVS